eukprot:jgi/Galph1/159/GphlegSOOS_G4911.1
MTADSSLKKNSNCTGSTNFSSRERTMFSEPLQEEHENHGKGLSLWDLQVFQKLVKLGSKLLTFDYSFHSDINVKEKVENGQKENNTKCLGSVDSEEAKEEVSHQPQMVLEEKLKCSSIESSTSNNAASKFAQQKTEGSPLVVPITPKDIRRQQRALSLPTDLAHETPLTPSHSFWTFWKKKHRCFSCLKLMEKSKNVAESLLTVRTHDDTMIFTALHSRRNEFRTNTCSGQSDSLQENLDMSNSEIGLIYPTYQQAEISNFSQSRITLFLLDWDDTLFASTMLSFYDSKTALSDEVISELTKLEQVVLIFLKTLSSRGYVAIVTNADAKWVEMTSQCFMPRVYEYLQKNEVFVVSARNLFGTDSDSPISACPSDWKAAAFLKLMVYFFSSTATEKREIMQLNENYAITCYDDNDDTDTLMGTRRNLKNKKPPSYRKTSVLRLCCRKNWMKADNTLDLFHRKKSKEDKRPSSGFLTKEESAIHWKFEKAVLVDKDSFACHHIIVMGDACFEHNAVNTLRAQYPNAHFKFIQFIPEPSLVDLLQQLKSVYGALDEFSTFAGNLDVRLKPQ